MTECQAFITLKDRLMSPPDKAFLDFTKRFCLHTDALNEGLGAVLAQKQNGKERLVCFAST